MLNKICGFILLLACVAIPSIGACDAILPITDISKQGTLPKLTDIGSTEASLVFISAVPLACTVVYGPTKQYGWITNDPDMSATATIDHNPILSGLKPDTEYHFRVQGVAADGRLFRGKDRTFRTVKASVDSRTNFAALSQGAKVIAVSSNYGGGKVADAWGANSAIDGSRSTAWSSNGDGNNAFIEIKFAKLSRVSTIEVWTRTMSDGTAQINSFKLTTEKGEVFGPFTLPDAKKAYQFPVSIVAEFLRLDVVESSGGNTGLIEFVAY